MPPPNGDGTTWYWFEQLYPPTVRRIHLEHFERVAFGIEASPGLRRKDCPRTRFRPDAAHSRQRSSGAPTPRTAPGQHMATAMDAAPPIRLNGACYWQNPRRAQAWRSHFSWDARRSQRASALSEDHPKRRKRKCPRRRCRPRTTSWNRQPDARSCRNTNRPGSARKDDGQPAENGKKGCQLESIGIIGRVDKKSWRRG